MTLRHIRLVHLRYRLAHCNRALFWSLRRYGRLRATRRWYPYLSSVRLIVFADGWDGVLLARSWRGARRLFRAVRTTERSSRFERSFGRPLRGALLAEPVSFHRFIIRCERRGVRPTRRPALAALLVASQKPMTRILTGVVTSVRLTLLATIFVVYR